MTIREADKVFSARNLEDKNIKEMARLIADLEHQRYDHWTLNFVATSTLMSLPKKMCELFEQELDALGVREVFET
jgi:hypothetical protein